MSIIVLLNYQEFPSRKLTTSDAITDFFLSRPAVISLAFLKIEITETLYQQKIGKQKKNTKTPPKSSVTQRLRTDLGRSVGVTTVIQLVWLNRV